MGGTDLQQIWELSEEEKKEAINKYVATLGDIVPCNLAILYDHKEPGYIEMMTGAPLLFPLPLSPFLLPPIYIPLVKMKSSMIC